MKSLILTAALLLSGAAASAYTTTYTCSYGSCTGRGFDSTLGGYRIESSDYGPTRIHTDSGNTYSCYSQFSCHGGY